MDQRQRKQHESNITYQREQEKHQREAERYQLERLNRWSIETSKKQMMMLEAILDSLDMEKSEKFKNKMRDSYSQEIADDLNDLQEIMNEESIEDPVGRQIAMDAKIQELENLNMEGQHFLPENFGDSIRKITELAKNIERRNELKNKMRQREAEINKKIRKREQEIEKNMRKNEEEKEKREKIREPNPNQIWDDTDFDENLQVKLDIQNDFENIAEFMKSMEEEISTLKKEIGKSLSLSAVNLSKGFMENISKTANDISTNIKQKGTAKHIPNEFTKGISNFVKKTIESVKENPDKDVKDNEETDE